MDKETGFYLMQRTSEVGDLVSRLDFKHGARGLSQGLREQGHSVLLRVLWEEISESDEYMEAVMVCAPPINCKEKEIIKFAGYELIRLNREEYEFVLKGAVKA